MTDRTQEILGLASRHGGHYRAYRETGRALTEAVMDRLDEVEPLEGEVWLVVPVLRDSVPVVIPATKCMIGWEISTGYLIPIDSGDNIIATRCVYPVKRIAEAPNTTGDTE